MLIFKNTFVFSFCYFALVTLDLFFLTQRDFRMWRLFSKPAILILLICFYTIHRRHKENKNFIYTILALTFFLLAGVANSFPYISYMFIIASIGFILGKFCYVLRFVVKTDISFKSALVFLLLFFIYMYVILDLIFTKLGNLLVPILLFLFVTLLAIQFALIRRKVVNKKSFWLVFAGMLLLLSADTASVLAAFYHYWPAERYVGMFLYALSQYFIIVGLAKEKILVKKEELLI